MTRTALILLTAVGLSAWASAQGTGIPNVSEQLRLLQANRNLLERLLQHGLDLSDPDQSPLQRADECGKAAKTLAAALTAACNDSNAQPGRVAELSDYLAEVASKGLAPALSADRIPKHSPHFAQAQALREQAVQDVSKALTAIPTTGPLGQSPEAQAARKKLTATTSTLGK